MSQVVLTERCPTCNGRGEEPMHYPDGRGGAYCNWQRCRTCNGTGRVRVVANTPEPEPAGRTLNVGGVIVNAPTFRSARQFDDAFGRAILDDLRVHRSSVNGEFIVANPTNGATYSTSRTACTCMAGQTGTPCKHIAAVVFELDAPSGRYHLGEVAS